MMALFNTTTATDANASPTDAGFDVNSVFNGILTVFGFFRKIIDFLKSFLTPLFEGLFDSIGDKITEGE